MFGRQAILQLPVEVSSPKKKDAFVNMTSEANKDWIIDDHLSYWSKVAEKVKENNHCSPGKAKEGIWQKAPQSWDIQSWWIGFEKRHEKKEVYRW